jgi:hypothetical protein
MTATRGIKGTKNGPRLHLAFEHSLSYKNE